MMMMLSSRTRLLLLKRSRSTTRHYSWCSSNNRLLVDNNNNNNNNNNEEAFFPSSIIVTQPNQLCTTTKRDFSSTTTTRNNINSPSNSSSGGSSDYVVIGAGSAGCVIASRLVEAGNNVTLLEAGSSDLMFQNDMIKNFFIHMPTALAYPMSFDKHNWKFDIEPEPTLNNRIISCPRGKGLGGSSSINGMVFVRGHPEDFNTWHNMGATGWSYRDVLPYFIKMENWQQQQQQGSEEQQEENDDSNMTKKYNKKYYRGHDGPLHVKFGDNAANTPLYDLFIKAGIEAGYGYTSDYNAYRQEGFSYMPMTVFHSGPKRGQRCSTSSSYLHPTKLKYPNLLNIQTGVITKKLLFDKDNDDDDDRSSSSSNNTSSQQTPRCIGVSYIDQNDKNKSEKQIYANKEVIVCCGSIQSPQLLQVSGIGCSKHLQEIGVKSIIVDNPNVGRNLQDHLELYFQQEVLKPISIAPILTSYFAKLKLGLQWIFTKKGLGATNHFEASAFVRSNPNETYPDIQFHFLPVGVSYDGVSIAKSKSGHSMQIHIGTCRSKSRGYVKAVNNDMLSKPKIQFNYMSHDDDWINFRKGIEIARQIMRQPIMSNGIAGEEILPGDQYPDVDEYIKDHVESAYHPCGTCKMGSSQLDSVVNPQGQVYGVSHLRVADASIFPQITNGNLNGPVIMVAEKIADMILSSAGSNKEETDSNDDSSLFWKPPSNNMDREKEPLIP